MASVGADVIRVGRTARERQAPPCLAARTNRISVRRQQGFPENIRADRPGVVTVTSGGKCRARRVPGFTKPPGGAAAKASASTPRAPGNHAGRLYAALPWSSPNRWVRRSPPGGAPARVRLRFVHGDVVGYASGAGPWWPVSARCAVACVLSHGPIWPLATPQRADPTLSWAFPDPSSPTATAVRPALCHGVS